MQARRKRVRFEDEEEDSVHSSDGTSDEESQDEEEDLPPPRGRKNQTGPKPHRTQKRRGPAPSKKAPPAKAAKYTVVKSPRMGETHTIEYTDPDTGEWVEKRWTTLPVFVAQNMAPRTDVTVRSAPSGILKKQRPSDADRKAEPDGRKPSVSVRAPDERPDPVRRGHTADPVHDDPWASLVSRR